MNWYDYVLIGIGVLAACFLVAEVIYARAILNHRKYLLYREHYETVVKPAYEALLFEAERYGIRPPDKAPGEKERT